MNVVIAASRALGSARSRSTTQPICPIPPLHDDGDSGELDRGEGSPRRRCSGLEDRARDVEPRLPERRRFDDGHDHAASVTFLLWPIASQTSSMSWSARTKKRSNVWPTPRSTTIAARGPTQV